MVQFDETDYNKRLEALHRKEEGQLIKSLAGRYGHRYIDLNGIPIETDALKILDEETARAANVAVFKKTPQSLSVAIRNPNNEKTTAVLADLKEKGFIPEVFMASTTSLEHAWKRYADIKNTEASQRGVLDIKKEEVARLAEEVKRIQDIEAQLVKIKERSGARRISETLELFVGTALSLDASDVHIEPKDSSVKVRIRLDGVLHDVATLDTETYELLRSRLKLLSGLKLNVNDRAQDGRFTIDLDDRSLEVRTSVIPGPNGESLVMRILDPKTIQRSLEDLGMNDRLLAVIKEEIGRPKGMIVTTGPTGSGKTTTLYAFLREVHRPEIKIITLEDPIEYHLAGVVQTQVDEDYTFSSGLRSLLRQDPDVLMVGEIRDREVAETAITAAETGHLVFSTLHTNSAAESFLRLLGLGVDARLIGSSINLVMAQRLVRRLCPHCKTRHELNEKEARMVRDNLTTDPERELIVYKAVGCDACGETGYKGRIGLHEGIRVDAAVEDAVINDPRESAILEAARPQKIPTIQEDGVTKLLAGETSLEELLRVIDLFDTRREAV